MKLLISERDLKRNIYKVTELKFRNRNAALPVKDKTRRPGRSGQTGSG